MESSSANDVQISSRLPWKKKSRAKTALKKKMLSRKKRRIQRPSWHCHHGNLVPLRRCTKAKERRGRGEKKRGTRSPSEALSSSFHRH